MSFKIVPSVPIAYGRLVGNSDPVWGDGRLRASNPLALVWHWMAQGAERIHVEEIGAPPPRTTSTLPALLIGCRPGQTAIQVGGGIRDARTASMLTAHGADTLVLSHTLSNPSQFSRIMDAVPGERIMIACNLDAELNPLTVKSLEIARRNGVNRILLSGPWQAPTIFPSQQRTIQRFQDQGLSVWIAGGLKHRRTVIGLRQIGIAGVIIGQAFYRGDLSYAEIKSMEIP